MSAEPGFNQNETGAAPAVRLFREAHVPAVVLADAAALPTAPGAYLLLVELAAPLTLSAPRPGGVLAPARYLYLGSARGPGGLRARLGRHLRAERRPRWHVDQVTAAGTVLAALAWLDGRECAWRAAVQARGAQVPVGGFGSSDCRRCPAHLLQLDAGPDDPRLRPGDG